MNTTNAEAGTICDVCGEKRGGLQGGETDHVTLHCCALVCVRSHTHRRRAVAESVCEKVLHLLCVSFTFESLSVFAMHVFCIYVLSCHSPARVHADL